MSGKPVLRVIDFSSKPRTASGAAIDWPLPARGDGYLQIRINRNTLFALLLSLLIHALLLYFLAPQLLHEKPLTAPIKSLVVNLAPPLQTHAQPAPPIAEPEPPPPETKPQPKPKPKRALAPRPQPQITHIPDAPKIPVVPEKPIPHDFRLPPKPTPTPVPPEPNAAPPTDMQAYVNAARARRESTENYAAQENAAAIAKERVPTEEEVRTANIQRNLQQGTNGIFEILRKSERTAQFSFKGWTNDFSNARRETITVEAGPNEDINRAIVRRMIALIRKDYSGDFNWESIRLNRVIILSARPEDNAGLEDFLLREFFGTTSPAP